MGKNGLKHKNSTFISQSPKNKRMNKKSIFQEVNCRGERIVFSGPDTNTNIIRFQTSETWPNTNTNTIRVQKYGRIQIRILFGFRNLAEYEYEYLDYSNNTEYEYE